MSQPSPYTPTTDFSNDESNNVAGRSTVRTAMLDAELAAIETTLDQTLVNLSLNQRDDGEIRDLRVKLHTLGADVRALLATTGCVVRGDWITATVYAAKDVVSESGGTYIAAAAHTSGTFATDLAADKWLLIASPSTAANVPFTPSSGVAASTVQAAIEELGAQVGDGAGGFGFINKFINGDMRIDQRNAGSAFTINGTTPVYTIDRWLAKGEAADGVLTVQRSTSTPPAGFSHFLRCTVSTADVSIGAGQSYWIGQRVEGSNCVEFGFGAAGALTVSIPIKVRSSLTGTFSGVVKNSAANRSYPFTFVISAANAWETKSITVPGDVTGTWLTDNGIGLQVLIDLGCGTTGRGTAGAWTGGDLIGVTGSVSLISTLGATFDFTAVQLNAGATAMPFDRRAFGQEIALCQRYFEKSFLYATAVAQNAGTTGQVVFPCFGASTSTRADVRFKVTKALIPTVTFYNPAAANAQARNANTSSDYSGTTAAYVADSGFHWVATASGAMAITQECAVHWSAVAEL